MSLVSIQIPAYNAAKWLEPCLDSILAQSHREIDLVIYDDGSTDETCDIASRYEKRDGRVRLITGQTNIGVGAVRESLLEMINGDFVWQIDADDIIPQNSVETFLQIANADRADLVRGNIRRYIDGRITPIDWFIELPDSCGNTIRDCYMLYANPMGFCLNFIRSSYIKAVGIPNLKGIAYGEDSILNSYFYSKTSRISTTSIPIYFWRLNSESATERSFSYKEFKNEADAHCQVFQNFSVAPIAQISFALRNVRYRYTQIRRAAKDCARGEAIAVISAYQAIYRGLCVTSSMAVMKAADTVLSFDPDVDVALNRFLYLMAHASAEDVFLELHYQ